MASATVRRASRCSSRGARALRADGPDRRAAREPRRPRRRGRRGSGALRSADGAEQLVGVLQTDGDGRYTYTAAGTRAARCDSPTRAHRASCRRSAEVRLLVPAASSLRVSRRRVLNGQAVTFSGRVRTLPVPAGGKLVELQVRLSGRWQTFRTVRTDAAGRWAIRYRFKRTRGVQRYRFRARAAAGGRLPVRAGQLAVGRVSSQGPLMAVTPHPIRLRVGAKLWRQEGLRHTDHWRETACVTAFASASRTPTSWPRWPCSSRSAAARTPPSRSAAATSRTARSPARSCKHNTLTGPQIKESSLARVPRARDADRLDGITAARAEDPLPSDTFPIADVCVERTPRAAGVVRQRRADVRLRSARRPGPGADCRRTASFARRSRPSSSRPAAS